MCDLLSFTLSFFFQTALLSYPFEMISSFSTEARYILYIVIKLTVPEKLTVCTKAVSTTLTMLFVVVVFFSLLSVMFAQTDKRVSELFVL